MAKIAILIGSTYGSTHRVAEHCAKQLSDAGHQVELLAKPTIHRAFEHADEILLVCTATIGMGEIPNNLRPLVEQLTEASATTKGKRYGIIAFGDSGFTYFANGGRQLDKQLSEFGLKRLGEALEIDTATVMKPTGLVLDWLEGWEKLIQVNRSSEY